MIYCSNCGTGMANEAIFCPECGTKTEKPVTGQALSIPVADAGASAPPPHAASQKQTINQTGKELQSFLKVSLPDLTKKILFDPLDGTKKILTEIKEPVKIGLFCIFICSFIITILVFFRVPSEVRQGMDFLEFSFKIFMLPIMGAFIIAFFSFITKSINDSRTASFGNEILTGGIVSIGYALFFVIAFLFSYMLESSFTNAVRFNSFGGQGGPPTFSLILIFSLFVYLLTITSNSLSQSLRSSGVKDGASFYLSPFLIIITAYLTLRIWIAMFGGKNISGLNGLF